MEMLAEDCMGRIFSFASPVEACRMFAVSPSMKSTVECDAVWDKFLPSDCQDLISRLVLPFEFSSKKELFFKLCRPRLIDEGKKMFWLDKRTCKKCYILSARELSIAWGSDPLYWSWKPLTGSRFAEVAELRTIWWLEIQGSIRTSTLSPNATYQVILIAQFADRSYGLDKVPSQVTIEVGKHQIQTAMYLRNNKIEMDKQILVDRAGSSTCRKFGRSRCRDCDQQPGNNRNDEWVEIELGEFYNQGSSLVDDDEIKFSLREVKGTHLRGGLIIEGMEIRATDE